MYIAQFDNSYARLPAGFYGRLPPQKVPAPGLIRVNRTLAAQLGIDPVQLESAEGVAILAGNALPEGADPIATVYAGHQFGGWNPQLGDGRALLLGEVIGKDGQRYDIQLKGSGPTPYSRGGDGKAPLGPVLREYLLSEAMAALNIPTTRTLAAVQTGEMVYRERPIPGAVLTRVAQSHIRIGTVQFFAANQDLDSLKVLMQHVMERHYPEAAGVANPILALLKGIIARQASLIARWQLVGFIHGVMNTDNMLLSGETIDYGPCAFMDRFDPATVFSSIDHGGRYAYGNQPSIAHWNLACLGQALLPVIDEDAEKARVMAQEAVDQFPELFMAAYRDGLCRKLGLSQRQESDDSLVQDLLKIMADEQSDFTLAFRRLTELAGEPPAESVAALFEFGEAFEGWLARWRERLDQDAQSTAERQALMQRENPAIIARNHKVEEAIRAAEDEADFAPFHRLCEVLEQPYDYRDSLSEFARSPRPEECVRQTFCGT